MRDLRRRVLVPRLRPAVADGQARQRDDAVLGLAVAVEDVLGEVRHVVPRVRLAGHEEVDRRAVGFHELVGVEVEEGEQEGVHGRGDVVVVPAAVRRPRRPASGAQARAEGLVDEEDVRRLVPAVGVHGDVVGPAAELREPQRAELQPQAVHAAAAGPAVEPEHEGLRRRRLRRLEEPVEELRAPAARVEQARPVPAREAALGQPGQVRHEVVVGAQRPRRAPRLGVGGGGAVRRRRRVAPVHAPPSAGQPDEAQHPAHHRDFGARHFTII